MPDDSPVSNPLCEARMKTIETKLNSMLEKIDSRNSVLDEMKKVCDGFQVQQNRIQSLEDWRGQFTITKIISTVSGATAGVLVIYETIKRFLM
jgi:hypothetical protein